MFWLICALVSVYLVYILVLKPYVYWEKGKISHRKSWPVIGNMGPFTFGIKSIQDMFKEVYDAFPNSRYMGMHFFAMPALLIRDPALIIELTIKNFDHFTDHALFRAIDELDPIVSKALVFLTGQKWKEMRSTIGPFFTSSKMKFMFTLIKECAKKYTNHLEMMNSGHLELEVKEMFTRFTTDVIATVGFGLDVNSLKERDNKFFLMGQKFVNIQGLRAVKLAIYVVFPVIAKLLNIPILHKRFEKYYTDLIKESIRLRETKGIVRPDMIHLFLEARKALETSNDEDKRMLKDLTDDSIIAQSLMFFSAGFANIANAMSFMSYELALNPDVQKRLQEDIDKTLEQCEGEVTYDALSNMKYLDMVLSETLRKWPTGAILDRRCVKDYTISQQLPEEEDVYIKKGTLIFFPMAAIHHDPKYYPNPIKFDPERFNNENKPNIVAGSFIPLGIGPRYCIASRYAYMKIKIMLFYLLSKFDIVPSERTAIPIVQTKWSLNLGSADGIWLALKKRSNVTFNNGL